MFFSRRLAFGVLVVLVLAEGFMFTVVTRSSGTINTDDDEELRPSMLGKHGGISKENISKRSAMPVGNFSNYFQGQFSRSCSNCGLINPKRENFMIIKGDVVNPPYKYPWMVKLHITLRRGMVSMCGGSIISANYILTAAHCLDGVASPRDVKVQFLTNTYSLARGPEVQQLIKHPQWNRSSLRNDIALLRLRNKITCDKFKNPICLPPSNFQLPEGTVCTSSGWGATKSGPRDFPRELRDGKIKLVNYSKCERTYGRPRSMAKIEYCFDGLSGNWQSTCSGDSGGPTFYERGGKYYQVGVTSSGSQGCQVGMPFMLTAVPSYINWIKQVTRS